MTRSALILRTSVLLLLMMMMYGSDAKMEIISSKQDILVGDEMLLLCKAGGEADITWQKDNEDVDDEDVVTKMDEMTSSFRIRKVTMQDVGKYTCLSDFTNGASDSISEWAYVHEGPSFGHTTTYHEFLEGTDGVVPCLVTGKPAVDVHWLRDKQKISSHEGMRVRQMSDNTLIIENMRREDAGTYTCQAQIRGRPVYQHLDVSVAVNAHPTVHLKTEEKKVLAGPENNVSLLCLVDGSPKPNITWTMPTTLDLSRLEFNSDRSQLTIRSVARTDFGEYVCTATNKIAENSATIMLHIFEAPEVFVSAEQLSISGGGRVTVSCNVSGHPQPELHWLNKHNGQTLDSTSGRVHVVDGALVIEDVVPSDGGLYSCMAVSTFGNASRDVAIHTQPGPPHYLSVSPGPVSVIFSLRIAPMSGGTPITSYVLQWRQNATEQWKETTVPASDPLVITSLKQYTSYTVRLAALNAVGVGQFSEGKLVRTRGKREPDSPVLFGDEMKVDKNSFSLPVKQMDDGGSPVQHFNIRYRQDKDGAQWKEMQLPANTDSISLQDLPFSSDYQLEITAVNVNGSSIPAAFNFTIAEQPVRSMTKGSVFGIVMVIFLVVFLVVDVTCCYRNRCGLLMTIAVKLFGQKVPGLKTLDNTDGTTNGEVKLKGISTPRGSMQLAGGQTKESGQLKEVTCDKASLTKHENIQPGRDLHKINA